MSLLDYTLPLDREQIELFLPHRPPFLLVDRVLECVAGESLHASRNIVEDDPILRGHFPGNPIVPGVLIVEGLAQASAILGQISMETHYDTCLLIEIEKCRFRRQVVPGDVLHYRVRLTKQRKFFYWFDGEAATEQGIVASATFSAKLA